MRHRVIQMGINSLAVLRYVSFECCVIVRASVLTVLSYVNLLLTGLFLWPLVRTGRISGPIRRIAGRTLMQVISVFLVCTRLLTFNLSGAIVALTTSTVNILMLTLEGGGELGWICLDSCGADVNVPQLPMIFPCLLISPGHLQCSSIILGHHS